MFVFPASLVAWTWSCDLGSANQMFPLQTESEAETDSSWTGVASLAWCQCGSGLVLQAVALGLCSAYLTSSVGNYGDFLVLRPLSLVLPPPNTLE